MSTLRLTPFRSERLINFCYPTEEFWVEWRNSKDLLKSKGVFLLKENDVWVVAVRKPDVDPALAPPPPSYQLTDPRGLFPYQVAPAGDLAAVLLRFGAAVDGSDPGTGKTYVAAAVMRDLAFAPVVVCPMSVMASWQRVLAALGVAPIVIVNWEFARGKSFNYGTKLNDGSYFWRNLPKNAAIIFDEAHKGKGETTQQSAMMIAARRQDIPHLLLSGSLAQSPREMRASGYCLDMHGLFDFNQWCERLGGYKNKFNKWVFGDTVEAMRAVNKQLYPARGVRIRIAELGDAFPETRITADSYSIEGAEIQNRLHEELMQEIDRLLRLKQAVKGLEIKLAEARDAGAPAELSASEQDLLEQYKKAKAATLTLDLRYRQDAELRKVPIVKELVESALLAGQSCAVFVNYMEPLRLLQAHFKAVTIHGQQKPGERDAAIEAFQADKARVIVSTIQAGGVGVSLHDIRGEFPRAAFIMPTYSAQDLKQVLGRVHRSGGKSKSVQRLIYAAGTVEESVCRAVSLKLSAMDALNDGELAVTPLWDDADAT